MLNSNKYVSGIGNVTVTLTMVHDLISKVSDMKIKFPKRHTFDSYLDNTKSCILIHDADTTIDKSAKCYKILTDTQDSIFIENAVKKDVKAGIPVIFTLANIQNPGSMKGIQNVEI